MSTPAPLGPQEGGVRFINGTCPVVEALPGESR